MGVKMFNIDFSNHPNLLRIALNELSETLYQRIETEDKIIYIKNFTNQNLIKEIERKLQLNLSVSPYKEEVEEFQESNSAWRYISSTFQTIKSGISFVQQIEKDLSEDKEIWLSFEEIRVGWEFYFIERTEDKTFNLLLQKINKETDLDKKYKDLIESLGNFKKLNC